MLMLLVLSTPGWGCRRRARKPTKPMAMPFLALLSCACRRPARAAGYTALRPAGQPYTRKAPSAIPAPYQFPNASERSEPRVRLACIHRRSRARRPVLMPDAFRARAA